MFLRYILYIYYFLLSTQREGLGHLLLKKNKNLNKKGKKRKKATSASLQAVCVKCDQSTAEQSLEGSTFIRMRIFLSLSVCCTNRFFFQKNIFSLISIGRAYFIMGHDIKLDDGVVEYVLVCETPIQPPWSTPTPKPPNPIPSSTYPPHLPWSHMEKRKTEQWHPL